MTRDTRVFNALLKSPLPMTKGEIEKACRTNDARKAISNLRAKGIEVRDLWFEFDDEDGHHRVKKYFI